MRVLGVLSALEKRGKSQSHEPSYQLYKVLSNVFPKGGDTFSFNLSASSFVTRTEMEIPVSESYLKVLATVEFDEV